MKEELKKEFEEKYPYLYPACVDGEEERECSDKVWTWFDSKIDRIREDSVRDFTEWVIDKRYSFGVDATVIGITIKQLDSWRDEYLKSKSVEEVVFEPISNKALGTGVIGKLNGVRFVASRKVKPNEIKVSGNLKSKSGGK
jgi:hypothetical protein